MAPRLLGDGLSAIGDMGIRLIEDAIALEDPKVQMIGEDVYYTASVSRGDG